MNTQNFHQSQRGFFAGALFEEMQQNENVWLLTGDLGFGAFDKIRDNIPARFINCGASEQAMMGIAVGLAHEGKIPFVYTITSFFLRAAETINLYVHHEQANVKLAGGGRDDDYKHDGYSHDGTAAQNYLKSLNISNLYPETKEEVPELVKQMINSTHPLFISLRR